MITKKSKRINSVSFGFFNKTDKELDKVKREYYEVLDYLMNSGVKEDYLLRVFRERFKKLKVEKDKGLF